jgi:protein-disulfide isomerase
MEKSVWKPVLEQPVSPDRDHIRGPADAPATLVEYGDYQCPYCGLAHSIVNAVRARLGDELRFVFRQFPLASIHPYAELAAEAAEAAGAQGKFWTMHDMLYENQDRLDPPYLLAYAEAIGLDVARFSDDLRTHAYQPRVQEDLMSGVRSGVQGTPSFFINGASHDGPWDFDSLLAAILAATEVREPA